MTETAVPGSGSPDGSSLTWHAPFRVDIRLTLIVHRRGPHDPTFRIDAGGAIWRTSLTPAGPATLRLTAGQPYRDGPSKRVGAAEGTRVQARAWGPGAAWMLTKVPDLLGVRDSPEDLQPAHPRLRDLIRRMDGLRIGRTDRVLEALVPAVLEQKVVGLEARRAWRRLVSWHGTPAPGPAPAGMRVVPSPARWQAIPSWDWHRAGVEAIRAATITGAASRAGRLEACSALPGDEADRLLQSLPGIGPWTAAEIRQRASGDADAVSVGDYHIPSLVGWALSGAPTDDAGMLELLAPYAGQRYRVTRLVELAGGGPPRRGPRLGMRDYSDI